MFFDFSELWVQHAEENLQPVRIQLENTSSSFSAYSLCEFVIKTIDMK